MMKIRQRLLVGLLTLSTLPVFAQQPAAGEPDLASQLARLNQAVKGTGNSIIKPQVNPLTTPSLAPAEGAQTTAPNTQSIAGALSAAENQKALPPDVQRQLQAVVAQGGIQASSVAPKPVEDITLRDDAFIGMTREQLPLSPDQIKSLKEMFTEVQRAQAADSGTPPKPTSTMIKLNLSHGATPPVIRLQAGFVSSLVFLDAGGSPWPVKAYDLGDPRAFNIQWNKKSNTLMVQAVSQYKVGNLAVILDGLSTPIMITLIPGQNAVDYRVDLYVPEIGPNTSISQSSLPGKSDPQLLNVLNGVSPPGARELEVSGGEAQIWKYQGKLFVRTRMTILSPGWISHLRSADGMQAYHLNKAAVILASQNGKMLKLIVKGL